MSYLDEGYNGFLERSIRDESTDRLSGLDFDSTMADNSITTAKVQSLQASKITTGTLGVGTGFNVGENNIKIDGDGRRIIINDGTSDRVLLGFQKDGF